MSGTLPSGGFAEPVFGAQSAFRAVMDAFANPGQIQTIPASYAPRGVAPGLAAIALTLLDHDTQVWLDPTLVLDDAVVAWLRFQTAAQLTTEPAAAQFALVSDAGLLPQLGHFALGTDEYPDRSTTVALVVPALTGGTALTLRGPGIMDRQRISPVGPPADFIAQWTMNRELFPRGVDLLLVAGHEVIGLPRTVRITEG